ncbi:MAG: hypothetical protein ACJAT4_002375 [Granulosicoccus sp.]|jgi:hypothetical protein
MPISKRSIGIASQHGVFVAHVKYLVKWLDKINGKSSPQNYSFLMVN